MLLSFLTDLNNLPLHTKNWVKLQFMTIMNQAMTPEYSPRLPGPSARHRGYTTGSFMQCQDSPSRYEATQSPSNFGGSWSVITASQRLRYWQFY